MFRDSPPNSDISELEVPVSALDPKRHHRTIDHSTIAGACKGFEGLMINRGRARDGQRGAPSGAHRRTLAAVQAARSNAMHVGIAQSFDQIDAANRLICQRYAWRGYSLEALETGGDPAQREATHHEIMFFAAEPRSTLGTITLRLDGPHGLSAEATHGETMQDVRGDGRRLGELTRLALAEGADSRSVLASLFGLVYAVGRMVHGVTDVFVEVNPRHVAFYSRALGFVAVGDERFCERVRAPSVLLHLDVEVLDEQLGFADGGPAGGPELRFGT